MRVGFGQSLIKRVLPDHLPQRGLGDLIDSSIDIFDRDDRLHRVDHAEIRHRRDIDADVVAGNDALGLDRHRDNPQRHPMQHVDERDDHPQPGFACAQHPAQPEHDALLILLDDLDR
jgi:hypothetical protein